MLYLDVYAIVLALATLGGATEIGSFPFLVVPPKVAKASTVMCLVYGVHSIAGVMMLTFANGNKA